MKEKIRTYCAMSKSRCGVVATVEDGRFVRLEPDADHPNRGICIKGQAAPELVYDPERLRYPLRRTTPKSDPDPRWARVGWDEAMEEIARRLGDLRDRHGAESVFFYRGASGGQRVGGVRTVADPLRQPVRQSQYGFHRAHLQLAQGQRLPLHVWNRNSEPGLRAHRLHPAVGTQPQRLLAHPGHPDLRRPQTGRAAHRHRSPGHPAGAKGGPLAQGPAGNRRAAGAELPQRDARGETVRR